MIGWFQPDGRQEGFLTRIRYIEGFNLDRGLWCKNKSFQSFISPSMESCQHCVEHYDYKQYSHIMIVCNLWDLKQTNVSVAKSCTKNGIRDACSTADIISTCGLLMPHTVKDWLKCFCIYRLNAQ